MELNMNNMETGQKCRILRLESRGATRKALLEMGLIPNTEVVVVRSAPLGDPLELLVRDYHLSVRKEDAEMIVVEVINE